MAIDFKSIRQQVTQLVHQTREYARTLQEKKSEAKHLLQSRAEDTSELAEKILTVLAEGHNQNIRCALPFSEPLNAHFPAPPPPKEVSILAADGSQIYPDRHGETYYSLVNIGVIQMRTGDPQTPMSQVSSQILFDELYDSEIDRISDGFVSLLRDLAEREAIARHAHDLLKPAVTLTDGQLELWEPGELHVPRKLFEEKFRAYLKALNTLRTLEIPSAGYVDRPRSDLIVRMLELAQLGITEYRSAQEKRPFHGLKDSQLVEDYLALYERSAIFQLHSKTSDSYRSESGIHFFYLNVGSSPTGHSFISRVEIPGWVAEDPGKVDLVHSVIVQQCRMLGAQPYPYLLHRAHEVATVSRADREQIDSMIQIEKLNQGDLPGLVSPKSGNKALEPRTRYQA